MCFADIFANFLNLKLTEVNCKDDLKNLIEIRLNFGKKLIISQLDICYQGWKVMFLFKAVLILTRVGGWVGGLEVIIKLTQFNCYCNCLLELSLAKRKK